MTKIEKKIKEAAEKCAQEIMAAIRTATVEELAKQGHTEPKRLPGRPPKAKPTGKRPGRPKGSKNKLKEVQKRNEDFQK